MERFEPRIKGTTSAANQRIDSLMLNLGKGKLFVPDYQRDSSQWNIKKKSLLIESIVNGLAIPPIMICPSIDNVDRKEIVDGQQRLCAIEEFVSGRFALASEEDVDYSENVSARIAGKFFAQLPDDIRSRIEDYELSVLTLPAGMDRGVRLEVFRRINEGGVPLSAQDLRLSTFG